MIILVHVHRETAEISACIAHVLVFAHTEAGGVCTDHRDIYTRLSAPF
jgi:hypothetical protein